MGTRDFVACIGNYIPYRILSIELLRVNQSTTRSERIRSLIMKKKILNERDELALTRPSVNEAQK